jgi:hypothetical protein
MDDSKSPLVWLFLILGLVLIGLGFFWDRSGTKTLSPALTVASIEKLGGDAFVYRNGSLNRMPFQRKQTLGHLDSVETGDLGEVLASFDSGARIRIKEHSLITFERAQDPEGFHVVALLKRGELSVESPGAEGQLFIGKNGDRIAASDYQSSPLAMAPVLEAEPAPAPTTQIPEDTGLQEKEIQEVMGSHRTSFLKCYTQLLQKDPSAKGQASLTFTIENNGTISATEVTSSSFQNEDFKKCLTEIMKKITFRAFKGPGISTLFPLNFE